MIYKVICNWVSDILCSSTIVNFPLPLLPDSLPVTHHHYHHHLPSWQAPLLIWLLKFGTYYLSIVDFVVWIFSFIIFNTNNVSESHWPFSPFVFHLSPLPLLFLSFFYTQIRVLFRKKEDTMLYKAPRICTFPRNRKLYNLYSINLWIVLYV